MYDKKKKDRTIGVAIAVIAVFLVIFLLAALVFPAVIARGRLNEKLDAYRELGDEDLMSIFDPLYRDGSFYGDVTADVSVEDAREIAEKVLYACDGAKYSTTAPDTVGNWDASIVIRKVGGGIATVYFTEDEFYVAKDGKQYRFYPSKDRSVAYSELLSLIDERIADSSKNK